MGNQVAGLTPPPLVNVEDCLSDMTNTVRFEEELSGSRLFKVAKAKRIDDGSSLLLVLKIFSSPNALQVFTAYQPLVQAYCRQIPGGHNLLSFEVNIAVSERNIVLKRDFIDQSLVDRLCIRPFLCLEEKKWIAFQLLCALAQLHRSSLSVQSDEVAAGDFATRRTTLVHQPLCHGDIKGENVLLTSWGWLLLTDPAPFKPCQLPIDNPSEFTHYFDSSRRRVCYLAPERFVYIKRSSVATPDDRTTWEVNVRDAVSTGSSVDPAMDVDVTVTTELDAANRSNPISSTGNDQNSGGYKDGSFEPQGSTIENQAGIGSSEQWFQPQLSLDPAMDLFSAGCVLLELFTDGSVVFTLADLLNYRSGSKTRLSTLLSQVTCEDAKRLITSLLSLDPKARGSAEGQLDEHRGKVFPDIFYTHLMPYMQFFLSKSLANPTLRMSYLRQTLPLFLKDVEPSGPEALRVCAVLISNIVSGALRPMVSTYITQTPNTSASVGSADKVKPSIPVHQPFSGASRPQQSTAELSFSATNRILCESGKVDALVCLLELYAHMPPTLLLDRVIPYCVDLTTCTHSSEVRSLALDCLVQILQHVTKLRLPSATGSASLEAFFLTEYLFPTLASLSVDPSSEIRLAYARCLPFLAESALRFLNSSAIQLQRFGLRANNSNPKGQLQSDGCDTLSTTFTTVESFDAHLSVLRRHIQDWFSDLDRQVRYALMTTRGLIKLVTFFGRSHASGTLLSHMITFLNDKEDPGLRASFYRQISPLISLLGAQSVSVIHPLLEQGLLDPDEMVIESCMQALTDLLRQSLLSAPLAVSFLSRALALTAHPTVRLRQSAVAYITCFARRAVRSSDAVTKETSPDLSLNDHTKTKPRFQWSGLCSPASVYARLTNVEVSETFFSCPIRSCFTSDLVLLSNLRQPILRGVIEAFVSPDGTHVPTNTLRTRQEFCKLLQERKASRAVTRSGESPCYTSPSNAEVASLFAKLLALGLTEPMEAQLLSLSPLFINLFETNLDRISKASGTVHMGSRNVDLHRSGAVRPQTRLINAEHYNSLPFSKQRRTPAVLHPRLELCLSTSVPWSVINLSQSPIMEYENILREKLRSGSIPRNQSSDSALCEHRLFGRGLSWRTTPLNSVASALDPADMNAPATGTLRRAVMLNAHDSADRFTHPNDRYPIMTESRHLAYTGADPTTADVTFQGTLVAHLHEHQAGLINLAVHGSGRLMASCSAGDGTVKLWNCGLWPVDADGYLNQTLPMSSSTSMETGSRTGAGSKPAGFTQIYSLPTRSSWTYSTRTADVDTPSKACRGLVWTASGSQVATVARGDWIHCVDVATGRQCGLNSLTHQTHGRALCLTASATSQFPSQLTLLRSGLSSGGGGDANLISYATAGNYIVARDLRVPFSSPPAWCLKQAREYGLIRSIAMHSCYTWFVTGTARGHLVSWDLRYERPIACTQLPGYKAPASLLNLQLVETPDASNVGNKLTRVDSTLKTPQGYTGEANYYDQCSRTLIVATTDLNNGVIIWDLEACASASSAAMAGNKTSLTTSHTSSAIPVVRSGRIACAWSTAIGYTPVRSILCLPWSRSSSSTASCLLDTNSDSCPSYLPSAISGGSDGRLRYWNFSKLHDCRVLAWSGEEESSPPELSYREVYSHGIRSFIEEPASTTGLSTGVVSEQERSTGLLTTHQVRGTVGPTEKSKSTKPKSSAVNPVQSTTFPTEGRLELRQPSVGHRNVVSDISLIRVSQFLLVSASMDGVIKIWR
ncbi:Phosphoinositide 3-kinase regulatory subunit 4 [Fasciola hepatica]|uniref:non-specific serine/threonine protein kinase n=1 Tax=Fasciola hepatica TaxID=6192 RepID=A0A4E0R546_FASHE|nr:Phosphoinositide 3-kinase regulatory subunit 4 [Fasciola hepatica]